MIRLMGTGLVIASLASSAAPLQCGSGSDLPREDSAGDALYNLAQDFHAKGNEQAAKETLRYLVEHYPSNRHVPAAREELAQNTAAAKSSAAPVDSK